MCFGSTIKTSNNHKDIQLETISKALADRARRCKDLEYVTIIINGKDHTYSKDEILEKGFKIKQTDMKKSNLSELGPKGNAREPKNLRSCANIQINYL